MKRWIAVILAACLMVSLVSCGSSEEQVTTTPFDAIADYYGDSTENAEISIKDLTIPFYKEESVNPFTCSDGVQLTLSSLLYEGLYCLDPNFNALPLLAKSYTYEDNTYKITIKEDIRFSDGTVVDAKDVEVSLDKARESERYASRLACIARTEGKGNVITITLDADHGSFLSCLDIPIVKYGTQHDDLPIGTGPYVLYENGGNPILISNPFYWQNKEYPVDEIKLFNCKNEETAFYAFSSNSIHIITKDLIGSDSSNLSFRTGSYNDIDTSVLLYLGFNMDRGAFENAELRKSISIALDRAQLISTCLLGHGAATQFPVSPMSKLYPAELEQAYSITGYEETLKSLGYNKGVTSIFTILVNEENAFKVALAHSIASSLSRLDFEVQVRTLPFETYKAELMNGRFDMFIGETKLGADWDLTALVGNKGFLNFGRYFNPNMDIALENFLSAVPADQDSASYSLYSIFSEEMPFVPICFKKTSLLVPSGLIENVIASSDNPFYNFDEWIIHFSKK